jgi:hypothetical protein
MIINETTKQTLAKETKHCRTIFSKAKGLMFTKQKKDKALVFYFDKEKIISLHMFFVFHPIDVLFLDKEKRVAEIKRNLKPFAVYYPKQKAKYIIELNSGTTKKTRIKDKIKIL